MESLKPAQAEMNSIVAQRRVLKTPTSNIPYLVHFLQTHIVVILDYMSTLTLAHSYFQIQRYRLEMVHTHDPRSPKIAKDVFKKGQRYRE